MKKRHYNLKELRKIVRIEDLGTEIWDADIHDNITCDGVYCMTLDDIQTALNTIIDQKLPLREVRNWFLYLNEILYDSIGPFDILSHEYIYVGPDYEFPDDEMDALSVVWEILLDLDSDIYSMEDDGTGDQISCVREAAEYISCFRRNQNLPKKDWIFPDRMKEIFISMFGSDQDLAEASQEERDRFVRWVDELAVNDNIMALHMRCYGKYSGNPVYKQDFMASRDDAERLFSLTKDPVYANTLGYIYYYGRCNQGEPEYEKAFSCFTFGAANGLYESIYKLSDMYKNGYGVIQSPETAFHLIEMVYLDLVEKYNGQQNADKFADVALRMGNMLLHGIGTEQDVFCGVSILLMAEYAIKERMREHDYYGDNVVAFNIQTALEEAKEMLLPEKNTGKMIDEEFMTLGRLLEDDYKISWKARPLRNGDWSVTFQRIPKCYEEKAKKIFLAIPEIYYCTFTDKVKGHVIPQSEDMPTKGKADNIIVEGWGEDIVAVLSYDRAPVLELRGVFDWRFPKPKKLSGQKVRLAGVVFTPGGRKYDYLCDIEDVHPGDRVIVNGYDGPTEVLVQNVTDVAVEDLALPLERYKKIERKCDTD